MRKDETLEPVRSVAVLRALQFGDLLCTLPALRALRQAHPDAHIALIGLPWASSFVARFPHLLDEHIVFPGYPGLAEQRPDRSGVIEFIVDMQARRFDLLLQMQGNGSVVNPLVALLGARQSAGFFVPGSWRPSTGRFIPYPDRGHEIRRMLALPEHLGMTASTDLEFPVHAGERTAASELREALGLTGDVAYIHPGARDETRRWPAIRFAAIGDLLADRGLQVVLTGTEAEREVTTAVARMMRAPAFNLAGRTPVGTLAALLADARLLVTNDTGVSHLAVATGTPSVVVFSHSDPTRWAPLDTARHRAVHGPSLHESRFAPASIAQVARPAIELLQRSNVHAA